MYPHYHTHISTSSNTCIHFIEYVYSHHRTRISLPHYMGVYVYAGAINRTLQLRTDCDNAADGLQQRCEQIAIYTRTPTKWVAKHSARRRGRFIVPVSLHYQIHISALPNICIHIITHTYPHHQTRAFISSNTYIHITAHAFPFPITCVFTYMRAR